MHKFFPLRLFFCFILLCLGVNILYAQSLKPKKNAVTFKLGTLDPRGNHYPTIPTLKLGLQSFSYSSGIERKLSFHKNINFTLQYSINYFNLSTGLSKKSRLVSNSLQLNTEVKLNNNVNAFGGVGLDKIVYKQKKYFDEVVKTESKFLLNDFYSSQSFFLVGLERESKLFDNNLSYSLQYNFGFTPLQYKLIQRKDYYADTLPAGFSIGIKYRY